METTANIISQCIWFDTQALEAAEFYTGTFQNTKILNVSRYGKEGYEYHGMPEGTVMTISFELDGQKFLALNGGPVFNPNPSVSFFVTCESKEEVDRFYEKLSEGGKIMMALDKYDWSEWYCFIEDRFGVSWQIYLGNMEDVKQKIVPSLMFPKVNPGKLKMQLDFILPSFQILLFKVFFIIRIPIHQATQEM
jgi:predicted 3-demethylubiquinone-9 3-methyltransferase (glyoxalase superfamily)